MTRKEFHRAVARATGDSLATIRRMGFSLVCSSMPRYDPEPCDLPPQVLDWDEHDCDLIGLLPGGSGRRALA